MSKVIQNPKRVYVQICRAENLAKNKDKKFRKADKWRIHVYGTKKKISSEFTSCPLGNPIWNFETELKLTNGQTEPISFLIVDNSSNHYGELVVPISQIKPKPLVENPHGLSTLQCSSLQSTKKCLNSTGTLFYRIWSEEFFSENEPSYSTTKRPSLFGFRYESNKNSRNQFYTASGSQCDLSQSSGETNKLPKRFSFFKHSSNEMHAINNRSKAKSLANIHTIEDIDQSDSCDSNEKDDIIPPDDIYNDVAKNFGWVRVGQICKDDPMPLQNSRDSHCFDAEKVEIFSIQPDYGPISGHFTVVVEGKNFLSGLYDLTYVCIDGVEPIDANICTEILSDNEMLVTMPPVLLPCTVTIHLELLDGFKIDCAKNFHYVDSNIDGSILTPRQFDKSGCSTNPFDMLCENEMMSSTNTESLLFTSDSKPQSTRDSGFNSCVDNSASVHQQRRLSDYGSQASSRSDRIKDEVDAPRPDLYEEVQCLRKEVISLKQKLNELEESTNMEVSSLKLQLQCREESIDIISQNLCKLKIQLLEDGMTKYLEVV